MMAKALLQAILDDPDDDLPRLAYADWLDENGDEAERQRAEFIRVQIERARLPDDEPRGRELEERSNALRRAHGLHWLGDLPTWAWQGVVFRRGFIAELRCTPDSFTSSGQVLRQHPIQTLRLRFGGNNQLLPLFGRLDLARVRELALLDCVITEDGLAALASNPSTASLQALTLQQGRWWNVNLAPLFTSPHLRGLRHLGLIGQRLSEEALTALIHSGLALESLHLEEVGLTGDRLGKLAEVPSFQRLRQLNVRLNHLAPSVGPVLARAAWRLESLNLDQTCLSDLDLAALAAAPVLKTIRRLEVRDYRGGAHGLAALASSSHSANLRYLDLATSRLTAQDIPPLIEGAFPALRTLILDNNPISDSGANLLLGARWPVLHTLSVRSCSIGSEGLERLAGHFPQVLR